MRKALTMGAVLIGVYIIVANATGFGKAMTSTASGVATTVKVFQGRG